MTFGQDTSWRKQAVQMLQIPQKGRVLDVGAGTGDLSLLIAKSYPDIKIVCLDLTPGMLAVAKHRAKGKPIDWVIADAQHLPFAGGTFERVISAFLLRNVTDIILALREQVRILMLGGRIVAMETTPPHRGWLRPLAVFHLRKVIPLLGRLIARDAPAYLYLPKSIEDFISGEHMAELVMKAGFSGIDCRYRMIGTVSIVSGQRQIEVDNPAGIITKKTRKFHKNK
jgi:demethylmenaquinone methyltransferase / 2-methoxy-6-polyprenyl-1,4-benzoquinol methylase